MIEGYFGGTAQTGATYELELHGDADAGAYRVLAFSAAPGAVRKPQGVVYDGESVVEARLSLLKQADKKRNGRERAYVYGMTGTPVAGQMVDGFAKKVDANGNMPVHPQLWQYGRDSVDALPPHIRSLLAGEDLGDHIVVSDRGSRPVVAADVEAVRAQLCGDVDPDELEAYLTEPDWAATRKYEGVRGGAMRVSEMEVVAFNRKGEAVPCPHHIAKEMLKLPIGTRIDGELVALDAQHREALYVGLEGARFAVAKLVAFDLLSFGDEDFRPYPEHMRALTLEGIFRVELEDQDAILLVERGENEPTKRAMLADALALGWEGLVFRHKDKPYIGGKSGHYVRHKLRRKEYDGVVMGYLAGRGKNQGVVRSVEVGLYDGDQLVSIGNVGGWTTEARMLLQRRWDDDLARGDGVITPFVITFTCEGFSAQRKVVRPGSATIRPEGDKAPHECTFAQLTGAEVVEDEPELEATA